jgi:hypothetical protein
MHSLMENRSCLYRVNTTVALLKNLNIYSMLPTKEINNSKDSIKIISTYIHYR